VLAFLLLTAAVAAASSTVSTTGDWEAASGAFLADTGFDGIYPPIDSLENRIAIGDRSALMPLVWMLVRSGNTGAAEIWFEGRGLMVPVTRRDLGIALSWYGRYSLYDLLSVGVPVPDDLEDDDYGPSLAAVAAAGWMRVPPDGLFHPEGFAGPSDIEMLGPVFFGGPLEWDRSWISMSELDELFHLGSYLGNE